jgi:hypothetical protein
MCLYVAVFSNSFSPRKEEEKEEEEKRNLSKNANDT